jgi:hypothetical protein
MNNVFSSPTSKYFLLKIIRLPLALPVSIFLPYRFCSRSGNNIRGSPIGMCSFILPSFSLPRPCLTFWPPSCPLSSAPYLLSSGSFLPPLLIVVLPSILTPFSDSTQTPPFFLRFIALLWELGL